MIMSSNQHNYLPIWIIEMKINIYFTWLNIWNTIKDIIVSFLLPTSSIFLNLGWFSFHLSYLLAFLSFANQIHFFKLQIFHLYSKIQQSIFTPLIVMHSVIFLQFTLNICIYYNMMIWNILYILCRNDTRFNCLKS